MFGADENARKGYDDPRQAVETCGMVEQMTSDQMLLGLPATAFGQRTARMWLSIRFLRLLCPIIGRYVI
jgi:hypothetical protein